MDHRWIAIAAPIDHGPGELSESCTTIWPRSAFAPDERN